VEARADDSSAAIRAEFVALLESHRDEVVELLVERYMRSEMGAGLDATNTAGMRIAAAESVTVMQQRLSEGDVWSSELPPGIAVPIQYMAREGWPLDRVLRGFTLLATTIGEFVVEHLGEMERPEEAVRYLTNLRGLNDDRMLAAFTAEYERELERLSQAPSRHLTERIKGLLDSGLGDFADLGYRLDHWHIGLIAMGPKAEFECRRLAEMLGCQLLTLPQPDDVVWAWLGAPSPIPFAKLEQAAATCGDPLAVVAGEPRRGLDGWRLTHREARGATTVGLLAGTRLIRFSDVPLLALCLADEVASRSLLDRYLDPLDRRRDGDVLRATLRAYIDLECNAASAAAALGVDRHTVQRRLRRIEESIGQSVASRRAELAVALRLEDFTAKLKLVAEGKDVGHAVPIRIPARTVLAHPGADAR
jgi:hypothetical protein